MAQGDNGVAVAQSERCFHQMLMLPVADNVDMEELQTFLREVWVPLQSTAPNLLQYELLKSPEEGPLSVVEMWTNEKALDAWVQQLKEHHQETFKLFAVRGRWARRICCGARANRRANRLCGAAGGCVGSVRRRCRVARAVWRRWTWGRTGRTLCGSWSRHYPDVARVASDAR